MGEPIHVTREALKPMAPPRPHFSPLPRAEAPAPAAGLISRTREIVAANVADLLDRAEDPAKLIRLVAIEMEEVLVEARAASARMIAGQKDMRAGIARLERAQQGWAERAELALAKGREDLARAALVEKRKAADAAEGLRTEIVLLDDALRAAEADVARVEAKLREARGRHRAVRARIDGAERRARLIAMHSGPRVDAAFSRFALLDRRVDEAEARAEALTLGAPAPTLADEIAALRAEEQVEAALAALKRRAAADNMNACEIARDPARLAIEQKN